MFSMAEGEWERENGREREREREICVLGFVFLVLDGRE